MKKKSSFSHWLSFFDRRGLLYMSAFLLAFIPLYPKIPLFSPIEQYIVRVRLEDIFIAITGIIWLIQVIRRKVEWRRVSFYLVLFYAAAGLLSLLNAVFILKTIPIEPLHLSKSLLHYFRYLEYFSLFIVISTVVKSVDDIKLLLKILAGTVIAIAIYGLGQKYLYWPVYSTMNREFSKGVRLYLTEHARVQSTFAGHYDLGAYLAASLPLLYVISRTAKKNLNKILLSTAFVAGILVLVLSGSKSSFVSYLAGVSLAVLIFQLSKNKLIPALWQTTKGLFTVYLITTILLFGFGKDMYDRFLDLIAIYPTLHNSYHSVNGFRKNFTYYVFYQWFETDDGESLIGIKVEKPKNAIAVDESGNAVTTGTETTSTGQKPSDVYVDVPDLVAVATTSATGETSIIYEERDRVYSDCANKHSLSLCIRFESLWPMAVKGFARNPFFGSGYATLNKEGTYHFTEAESTDNNFLRTLGETGLFGFISFYGIIILACLMAFRVLQSQDEFEKALAAGILASSIALFLNALYIDVFAASKVAFSYWALIGLFFALITLPKSKKLKRHVK